MYEISIKHRDLGKRTYQIYTKSEADKESIKYVYWKEAEKGQYALTDDNYVSQVIQKKRYDGDNGVSSYYVRMPFGYAFHSPKYPTQKLKAEKSSWQDGKKTAGSQAAEIKHNNQLDVIGIAFSFQKYKKLPISPHDYKLSKVFTEKGFIK